MRRTVCICDRCGKEITEGVVYSLTVYAEDVRSKGLGASAETVNQNMKQNITRSIDGDKDLCKECKDQITDGLFIV